MKAHILQHVEFEDIGSIASWLKTHDADVTYTRFYQNIDLPSPDGLDLAIIMGGPMSANDESMIPWLLPEKQFIRSLIRHGIPTLGICLGAQLIASAFGARVYRNTCKEIGWFPIMAEPPAENAFRFPEQALVFHWHGETFDLPSGALLLAKSEGCKNQAFQIGRNVIGLQFHLEITPECVRSLVSNCRGELVSSSFVQTKQELLQSTNTKYNRINTLMDEVLCYITGIEC